MLSSPSSPASDADGYALTLAARGFERIGDRDSASHFLDRAAFPATGRSSGVQRRRQHRHPRCGCGPSSRTTQERRCR